MFEVIIMYLAKNFCLDDLKVKKGKRKVQWVPHSQTAALPRPQEEEETDKSKQAQTKQTYKSTKISSLSSPSEVIAILKGLKNTRTKWHRERHTTNRLVEKTFKFGTLSLLTYISRSSDFLKFFLLSEFLSNY